MRIILFLTFIYFCHGFGEYTPATYPDSLRNPALCGLKNAGYICDPSGILGNHSIDELDVALTNVQYNTNCSCEDKNACKTEPQGFVISVAILEKIKGNDNTDSSLVERLELAETFAKGLRIRLNRGQCGDEVLIVLSKNDSVVFTSPGGTAAKILTQDIINEVDDKIRPRLSKNEYFEALSEMILAYEDVFEGKYYSSTSNPNAGEPWYHPLPLWAVWVIGGVLLFLILLIIAIIILCCLRKKRTREYTVGRVNYNTKL